MWNDDRGQGLQGLLDVVPPGPSAADGLSHEPYARSDEVERLLLREDLMFDGLLEIDGEEVLIVTVGTCDEQHDLMIRLYA